MASIFDLFNNDNAVDAANAQKAGIAAGQANASSELTQGLNSATGSYMAGLAPYATNTANANKGVTAYTDLLGLNGPQGNANATAALQNTPGYQFALDAGNQSVLRNKAATGQLSSGATDVDLQKQGIGTATNTAYAPYLQALQQFLPFATQSAQGQGALYSGLAGTQSASHGQQASLDYGAATSAGNADANADLANNQAAANQFGLAKAGVSLGAQLLGMI